jgi:hypothetical protein
MAESRVNLLTISAPSNSAEMKIDTGRCGRIRYFSGSATKTFPVWFVIYKLGFRAPPVALWGQGALRCRDQALLSFNFRRPRPPNSIGVLQNIRCHIFKFSEPR